MILMYHKVAPETPTMWWVSADAFYRQMWELRGKKVVYLDDYVAGDESNVCITFDGIYDNVCKFALPILEQFGYPYELFVASGSIGAGNEFDSEEPPARFADRDQLRDAVARGGRLQWHTQTHQRLTDDLPLKTLRNELQVPGELRDLDPSGFRWVAYPHGEFTARTVKEAKRFFRGGVSCHQGDGKSPFELNRLTVVDETRFLERRIGVVVPSYNYGAFLAEAAESVLRQRIQPNRILIIDDASTDDTEAIGRSLQQSHPRLVTFERNKKNRGIVGTFNKAVEMMETDYVVFLGADNRFLSNYLEKCSEVLDSDPAVGVAYTDYALFGPRAPIVHGQFPEQRRGRVLHDTFWLIHFPEQPGEVTRLMAAGKENVIHGSAMFRRQAWVDAGGYRKFEEYPEDFDLFRRILKAGWKPQKARGTYLEYRHHSSQQANATLQTATTIRVLKEAVASMRAEAEEKARLAKLAQEEADTKAQQVLHFQRDAEERAKHIAILQRENEEKTKQVVHFQRDFEERGRHIAILKEENEEKTGQVLHFQRHAEEQAKHIGILQQANEEKTGQVTHFQGEAVEKAQRLAELQQQSAEKAQRLTELQQQNEEKAKRLAELQQQSEERESQLTQARLAEEAKSRQLAEAMAKSERATEALERLAEESKRSVAEAERIRLELQTVRADKEKAVAETERLQEKIASEMERLRSQVEQAREQLSNKSNELVEVRWEMLTQRADVLRRGQAIEAPAEQVIELQDRLEAATGDRDQLRGMIMALQNDVEQERLNVLALLTELRWTDRRASEMEEKSAPGRRENEAVRNRLEATEEKLRAANDKLKTLQAKIYAGDDRLAQAEEKVGRTEARLAVALDQLRATQAQLKATQEHLIATARESLEGRKQLGILRERVSRRLILPFGKSQRELEKLTRQS